MAEFERKSLKDARIEKLGERLRYSLTATWYYEKWWEKILLLLGQIALFYSVARIFIQGFW